MDCFSRKRYSVSAVFIIHSKELSGIKFDKEITEFNKI